MSFAKFALTVVFPRSSEDLRDTTRCPACFTPLSGLVCQSCRLDVRHPAARELAETSANAAALLDHRVDLIGQIRYETDAAIAQSVQPPAADATVSVPAPQPSAPNVGVPTKPDETATVETPAASAAPSSDSPVAGRSSVQVILLIVGVSLLSIAAVFFLVYAYLNYGLIWRSVIVGSLTIAAFAVASVLRRRKLVATAEGIAVFAVVLFYLDAFAIRANDFFRAGSADPLVYWGFTLLFSAVAFVLWNRASQLRAASIVGFAAIVPGAGLLAAGLAIHTDGATRFFIAFAAAATAGLVHPVAMRSVEKLIAMGFGFIAFVIAFAASFAIESRGPWALPSALFALAVIAVLHVLTAARFTASGRGGRAISVLAMGFGGAAGLVGSLIAIPNLAEPYDPFTTIVLAPVVAVVVALVFDVAGHRLPGDLMRSAARVASLAALVGCLSIFAATFWIIGTLGSLLGKAMIVSPWRSPLTSPALQNSSPTSPALGNLSQYTDAVLAFAIVGALIAAASLAAGRWRPRLTLFSWLIFTFAVVAVPLLSLRLDLIVGWFVLAIMASALAIVSRRLGRAAFARSALITAGIVAALLGYGVAWGSPTVWLVASSLLVIVFIGLRAAVPVSSFTARSVLVAAALVIAFIASAAGAHQLSGPLADSFAAGMGEVRFVGLLATLTLGILLLPKIPGVSLAERRTAFWFALPVAAIAGAITSAVLVGPGPKHWAGAALPEYLSSVIASGVLLTVVVLWAALRRSAEYAVERQATSPLVAAALCWTLAAVGRELGWSSELRDVAPIAAAALVVATSLVLAEFRVQSSTRVGREIGAAAVGLIAVAVTNGTPLAAQRTVYLIASLTLLAWAVLRSRSKSPGESVVASLLIAPSAWAVAFAGTRVFTSSGSTAEIVQSISLSAVGVLSVCLSLRDVARPLRRERDIGLVLIGAPAVLVAMALNTSATWLVLILSAVTALALSMSADGLFASKSLRRHLVWVAVALAVAGLWWRLVGAHIRNIDAFVLPLAGVLLVMAVLSWRAARRTEALGASPAASIIFLAALLVGVIPHALNIGSGDGVGALIIGLVSAMLLLAGSYLRGGGTLRPFLDGAVLVGWLGVLITVIGRAIAYPNSLHLDLRLDEWVTGAFVVFVAAAFALSRQFGDARRAWYRFASEAILISALLLILLFEALVPDVREGQFRIDEIRTVAVITILAVIHVLAQIRRSIPLAPVVGWTTMGLSAVALLTGLERETFDPIELGVAPIAIALLVGGAVHLARNPKSRSWTQLAPGLGMVFGPSLLATVWDRPLWRLVAIGVVAVVVIVVAVVLRLQAPFVIGVVVVLVHGIATFAPQIRDVYLAAPWWLWAGVGGALLIVLAARYEHRIKNLKSAALLLGSLR